MSKMYTIREVDIEDYFSAEAARRLNAAVYKTVAVGIVGYPDRTLFWKGKKRRRNTKLVELKRHKKKPSRRQEIEHDKLRIVGQDVAVIDSHAAVDALLDELETWP